MGTAKRVLIVDDSATGRLVLRKLFAGDARITVVGEAANGRVALQMLERTQPDIVVMDVVMPVLGGLEATAEMMAESPRPVLLISELVGKDARLNFRALQSGALDLSRKPTIADLEDPAAKERFLRQVLLLAEVPVITRHRNERRPAATAVPTAAAPAVAKTEPRKPWPKVTRDVELVLIGASTGGPPALLNILTALGAAAPWPILIAQHMSPGFLEGMARWLSSSCAVPVEMGRAGVVPEAGKAYLAPDGAHLEYRAGTLRLDYRPPERGNLPSINYLFESVARDIVAPRAAAVLLTGMGEDGARGLLALREAGAWTAAQDQASSVVYGMPKAARDNGAAQEILALDEIGARLLQLGRPSASRRSTEWGAPG